MFCFRLLSEVDDVLENKDFVNADDLEKLEYTEQVKYSTSLSFQH